MADIDERISLPPENVYHSFDALFLSLQEHGISAGCAYVIRRGDVRNNRLIKLIICKRGRKKRARVNDKEYRLRHRHSFKCECPFSVKARERNDGS
jgi:hypothetical protein